MRFSNAIALLAIVASTNGAGADEWDNCRGGSDLERIIASCTKLIETPGIDPASVGHAFSRRAYGYARSGHEERAIRDYDEAIRILLSVRNPDPHDPKWRLLNNYRAIAYNNRSNAYFLLGKAAQSLSDADKAVEFAPQEPHFYAQRGTTRQSLGDQQGAIGDHDAAMALGGTRWIKHYQCGLRLARLYSGPIDGTLRPELHTALRICVDKGRSCPAWSGDPECPDFTG